MTRTILSLAFALAASTAQAAVDIVKVPAMCGTSAEILDTLAVRMPKPELLGKGGDSRGQEIATLVTGNGYWALLALMSPENVCVVASGFNWTAVEADAAQ
jgi:hypothetical protein